MKLTIPGQGIAALALRCLTGWLLWTVGIVASGCLVGGILLVALGAWLDPDVPSLALAQAGAKDIGFYALVWAPGAALVITYLRESRRRRSPDR